MEEIVSKFRDFDEINEEIKTDVKLFFVFIDYLKNKTNVILVTNEDTVFCLGRNRYGVLGFGHKNPITELTENEELSNEQIIDFKYGVYHAIARNSEGKLYCWGLNKYLGNGKNDNEISRPELNKYLINENIIEYCCGNHHTLALTSKREVYAWGRNDWGQIGNRNIFIPIKFSDSIGEKVKSISCGYYHSMVLTENGHVYSWGDNRWGQLGLNNGNKVEKKPKRIQINFEIEKISCGTAHSLLLSNEKDIYVFGWNQYSQLGLKTPGVIQYTPIKLNTSEKFIEIITHYYYHISAALSENGVYCIWGEYRKDEVITEPKETQFKSLDEIFAYYFQSTYKTIDRLEESQKSLFSSKKQKYVRDFRETEFISSGSFGEVYKVSRSFNSNKFYAVKKIPLSDDQKEKLSKESKLMAKMNNKFVVKLFDFWIEENNYWNHISNIVRIVVSDSQSSNMYSPVFDPYKPLLLYIQMELCYKTLREIIETMNEELNQKEPEERSLLSYYISSEILKELIECLNYLHERNPPIIHRDLKPANILISYGKDGRFVKLADFGLAVTHESKDQSHSQCSGTDKYMAPEVRESKKYDTKADIYSLGVITVELFKIDDFKSARNLSSKKIAIEDLITQMTVYSESLRPTCNQILSAKESWEMKAKQLVDEKKMKFERKVNSIEESFHLYFIQTKLQFYEKFSSSSDKCIIA